MRELWYGNTATPLHLELDIHPETLTVTTYVEASLPEPASERNGERVDGGIIDAGLAGIELYRHQKTFTLAELYARPEHSDCCLWLLLYDEETKAPEALYNSFGRTLSERLASGMQAKIDRRSTVLHIQVPFKDMDWTEMGYRVTLMPGSVLKSNLPFTQVSELSDIFEYLPTLAIEGPDTIAADGEAAYTVKSFFQGQPTSRPLAIEMRYENGYLPKTHFTMQGERQFTVSASKLEASDEIELKAGFKFRTSMATKAVAIVRPEVTATMAETGRLPKSGVKR